MEPVVCPTGATGDAVADELRTADRVVVEIAMRRADAAERAGRVSGSVEAYAAGIDRRIRAELFPKAFCFAVEQPGLSVEEIADRLERSSTPRRRQPSATTVRHEQSRHPAWVAERRRRGEELGQTA